MSRAIHFKEKRNQHLKEMAEDYTEMISDLIVAHGNVRVCDLAREMGISHVSVLNSLKKLFRDKYVRKSAGLVLELTPKGKRLAAFSKKKHQVLFEFLLKIGVSQHVAATDVEGIEHHISEETLHALEIHLQSLYRS
jgi:DtxR family manganese transport transcriptional regulator